MITFTTQIGLWLRRPISYHAQTHVTFKINIVLGKHGMRVSVWMCKRMYIVYV